MKKRHAFVIALMIGLVSVAGLIAATRTAHLGRAAQQPTVSTAQIAARNLALDRTEARLRHLLAEKPAKPAAAPTAPPQKVVYVRPAPHVVTIHRSHGDDGEAERGEHEGEFDD